jgi:hypothetical protein
MSRPFRRRSLCGGAEPSLDAVCFDTTGHAAHGKPQPGRVRVWHTPEGNGLSMCFFPVPPDLPANVASVDELVAFHQRPLGESGGKLVEVGEDRQFRSPGWSPDDTKHDAEFPDHAVARVRRVLDHVTRSLAVAEEVRELPGFAPPPHPSQAGAAPDAA